MPLERTEVPYPTYGPGDGQSWHEYFVRLHAERPENRVLSDEQAEEVELTRVEVPTRQIAAGDPVPSSLLKWKKLLDEAGYDTRVAYRRERIIGQPYKTGPRAGELREDRVIHYLWLRGKPHDDGGVVRIGFSQPESGKPVCDYRVAGAVGWPTPLMSDKEMREYIAEHREH